MSIEVSLVSLEKQVRVLRLQLLAIGVLCGILTLGLTFAIVIVAGTPPLDSRYGAEAIRTRALHVVDASGRTVVEMAADESGAGTLKLYGQTASELVRLGARGESGVVAVQEPKSDSRVVIGATDVGMSVLAVHQGKALAELGSNSYGRGWIRVAEPGGEMVAALTGTESGGLLQLGDGLGDSAGGIGAFRKGDASGLIFLDRGMNRSAILSSDPSGEPNLLVGTDGPAVQLCSAAGGGMINVYGRSGEIAASVVVQGDGSGVLTVREGPGGGSTTVQVEGVQVCNRGGAPVATLISTNRGDGGLMISNSRGQDVFAAIVQDEDLGGLLLLNSGKGEPRASIAANDKKGSLFVGPIRAGGSVEVYGILNGDGGVRLLQGDSNLVNIWCTAAGDGIVTVGNRLGNMAASLSAGEGGEGLIMTSDGRGGLRWRSP